MTNQPATIPAAVLKAVFLIIVLLVLGAVGYAGWIVSRYWHAVGV